MEASSMIDKINRIFAGLAKVHAATYFLVGGACTAFLYIYFINLQTNKEWLIYVVILTNIMNFILTKLFYEKYELGRKNLPTHRDLVMRDAYFYTKINSDITSTKRLTGYLYVLFRMGANIFIGFTLFAIIFSGVKKGLGL